jgi:hypothetical protein
MRRSGSGFVWRPFVEGIAAAFLLETAEHGRLRTFQVERGKTQVDSTNHFITYQGNASEPIGDCRHWSALTPEGESVCVGYAVPSDVNLRGTGRLPPIPQVGKQSEVVRLGANDLIEARVIGRREYIGKPRVRAWQVSQSAEHDAELSELASGAGSVKTKWTYRVGRSSF